MDLVRIDEDVLTLRVLVATHDLVGRNLAVLGTDLLVLDPVLHGSRSWFSRISAPDALAVYALTGTETKLRRMKPFQLERGGIRTSWTLCEE